MSPHELAPRLRLRGRIDQAAEQLALKAAFAAAHLFGIAAGISLRQLRAMNDPLAEALSRTKEAELKALFASRAIDILGERFDRLPERRRPFYTPHQRFQILELGSLLGWPQDQLARVFRVCTQTIRNWQKTADPDGHAVGATVRQAPPITRFADVVRNTLHQHRLGTIDRIFATARLERFWRTLKGAAQLRTRPPLTIYDLERRLETMLTHYLCFRPHQALHGATPAEAFLGVEPACTTAVSPPRAGQAEGPQQPPFTIDFLDPDTRSFPILKRAA